MGSLLHYLAALDNRNDVRIADGGQPVCHNNASPANHQAIQSLLDKLLALSIQRACSLVKQEDLRILEQGTSNSNALLLSPRKHDSTFTTLSIVTLRQRLDEIVGVRQACGLLDTSMCADLGAVHDVVLDGHGKEDWLLLHKPDLVTQPLWVILKDVHSVDQDGTTLAVVETLDEVDEGGLATSRRAHQRKGLARRKVDAQAVHDLDLGARRVVEMYFLELNMSLDAIGGNVSSVVVHSRDTVKKLEDTTRRSDGLHELREDGDQGGEREDGLEGEKHIGNKASNRHLVLENQLASVPHSHQDTRVSGQVSDGRKATGNPGTALDDQVRNVDLVSIVRNLLLLHDIGTHSADVGQGLVSLGASISQSN
mmetsp:Transcript_41162/g.64307  ORF Transcript_41162/g.64307 Transcript_41162/m.64307 type:complete len:368 (-) Transcript_41162:934-2037(-)